ncbi:hypothetical protein [Streptomyces sp. MP131-18]|uniref:hypothetical protein n=1 Tax=Streptomyces sp. MP131-18 TaxID=1857892 RepID=UPI001C0DEBEF|nr:hypothetical protein [Streptomyces sp. MP131-18]
MVFDPSDPVLLSDPYPVFAALRERAPVHWHAGMGLAVAVSHAACSEVLRSRSAGRIWTDKTPAAAPRRSPHSPPASPVCGWPTSRNGVASS